MLTEGVNLLTTLSQPKNEGKIGVLNQGGEKLREPQTFTRSFRSKPSKRYLKTVEAIGVLGRTEDWDIAARANAEAVSEQRLSLFTEQYGVSPSRGHICVYRLLGKRCPSFSYPYEGCPEIPRADHLSMWNKDGKPFALVSQPYGPLDQDDFRSLVNFCAEYGLEFTVDAWSSWHFSNLTLSIVITKDAESRGLKHQLRPNPSETPIVVYRAVHD